VCEEIPQRHVAETEVDGHFRRTRTTPTNEVAKGRRNRIAMPGESSEAEMTKGTYNQAYVPRPWATAGSAAPANLCSKIHAE